MIQRACLIPDKKRRRLSTSYSFPLGFLATTNLEPWLSQETEISSRRSLLSNKILFNGRDITESLIIQRNRSRGKKIRAASVSSLSILYPVVPVKSCPRERTLVFKIPLFAPGDLAAITIGCSYTLPVSSPCGLFNAGLCFINPIYLAVLLLNNNHQSPHNVIAVF